MEFRKKEVKLDTKIAVHVVQIDKPSGTSSLSASKMPWTAVGMAGV